MPRLRAFFDCEGWVEVQRGKSRLVGLECCNASGILQIKIALLRLGINCNIKKKKGRTIWRLTICGKDNIILFQEQINFVHPNKKEKLREAIESYVNHDWKIPQTKQ